MRVIFCRFLLLYLVYFIIDKLLYQMMTSFGVVSFVVWCRFEIVSNDIVRFCMYLRWDFKLISQVLFLQSITVSLSITSKNAVGMKQHSSQLILCLFQQHLISKVNFSLHSIYLTHSNRSLYYIIE